MQIFERSILPTHRLKYTQFILFYTASLQKALPDKFLEHLCTKMSVEGEPVLRKQACASYIGSYIARCNHLSRDQMVRGLQFLGQTALQYLSEVEPAQQFPDAQVHSMFDRCFNAD